MIERLVRRRGRRGQSGFANEAMRLLRPGARYLGAMSHRGLHLLAHDAGALAAPLLALRAIYGSGMHVDDMAAAGASLEVRIGVEARDLAAVRAAIARRGANPSEEYVGVHYCVLRFDAPLAAVLGLPLELEALANGRVSHEVVLRRHD